MGQHNGKAFDQRLYAFDYLLMVLRLPVYINLRTGNANRGPQPGRASNENTILRGFALKFRIGPQHLLHRRIIG